MTTYFSIGQSVKLALTSITPQEIEAYNATADAAFEAAVIEADARKAEQLAIGGNDYTTPNKDSYPHLVVPEPEIVEVRGIQDWEAPVSYLVRRATGNPEWVSTDRLTE